MGSLRGFYASAVGKKVVMGVTGLIGIGFVILHSLGNLLVFRGPDAINSYSHFLKSIGELPLLDVGGMWAWGFHLFHGGWSSVGGMGRTPPSPQPLHRRISLVIAILVWAAFTAVPVAVFAGIVR